MPVAFEPRISGFRRTASGSWLLKAGLLLTLVVLLAHAWQYRFLTDDAYISFRYARNLSQGQGLVFNPGMERVEGYSNFLWVLGLAALDRMGVAPERAANPLSLLFTVALWALLAAFLWQRHRRTRDWWLLVPLAALAACRSFAVWSTGGLETRLFELLVVAGVLRLVHEMEGHHVRPPLPLGAALLGLAALTRPDGVLIAACALGAAAAIDASRYQFQFGRWFSRVWPCVALVAAQLVFRYAYYHEWVPNTYFAKVGGRMLWGSGLRYVAAFVLEYGLWLWLPVVALGTTLAIRRRAPALPAIVLAVLIPHTLYVMSIGGDHFEYRPLDLWFPLLALLLADGFEAWSELPLGTALSAAYACVMLAAVFWIPAASHREFPHVYTAAFPGDATGSEDSARFLDPDRDPLLRWPPFRQVALAHLDLTRWLTRHFVAVRQEEHAMFLANATVEAGRLRSLMDRGVLPRDTYFAMSSVGVIPYVTNARTLDRLGLTDAVVAHGPFLSDLMAHGKLATMDYARRRGVDLWFCDQVYGHASLLSRRMMTEAILARRQGENAWAAEVAPDTFLLCRLPQGPAAAARRMPKLAFRSLTDSTFSKLYFARAIEASEGQVRRDPRDGVAQGRLAALYVADRRYADAEPLCRAIVSAAPGDPGALDQFAACQLGQGNLQGAAITLERQRQLLVRIGGSRRAEEVARNLNAVQAEIRSRAKPID